MSKMIIPINDKKWDVTGQFAETRPVYELLKSGAGLNRQLRARDAMDNTKMESASKTLERIQVEKIDALEDEGMYLTVPAYMRSLQFHWWDGDEDAYTYWDLR